MILLLIVFFTMWLTGIIGTKLYLINNSIDDMPIWKVKLFLFLILGGFIGYLTTIILNI